MVYGLGILLASRGGGREYFADAKKELEGSSRIR